MKKTKFQISKNQNWKAGAQLIKSNKKTDIGDIKQDSIEQPEIKKKYRIKDFKESNAKFRNC